MCKPIFYDTKVGLEQNILGNIGGQGISVVKKVLVTKDNIFLHFVGEVKIEVQSKKENNS